MAEDPDSPRLHAEGDQIPPLPPRFLEVPNYGIKQIGVFLVILRQLLGDELGDDLIPMVVKYLLDNALVGFVLPRIQ
jgi:hypothetical protein